MDRTERIRCSAQTLLNAWHKRYPDRQEQLSNSTDPLYLLTCSGSKVVAIPASSVVFWTYGEAHQGASLLGVLQQGKLPALGLVPDCPSNPPPAP
jgi:hypothetical protein